MIEAVTNWLDDKGFKDAAAELRDELIFIRLGDGIRG